VVNIGLSGCPAKQVCPIRSPKEREPQLLGNSLTITLDGAGGTAKVLPLINQDSYSSEYFLNDALYTLRAKVRHSRDTVKAGSQAYERHTVHFERYTKPTVDSPSGSSFQITFIIRNDPNGSRTDIVDLSEAMSFYMVKAGNVADKLLNWES